MTDILGVEIEAEQDMLQLGHERYWNQVSRAIEKGRETDTPPGRWLLRGSVGKLSNAIRDWLKNGMPARGKKPEQVEHIRELGPDLCAFITCRGVLDQLSKPRTVTSVSIALGRHIEDELAFRKAHRQAPELVREVLRSKRRSGPTKKHASLRAAIRHSAVSSSSWPTSLALRVGRTLLELLIESTDLVEIEERIQTAGKTIRRILTIHATDRAIQWIAKSHEEHERLHPLWMPMRQEPLEWFGLFEGGYCTDMLIKRPLVKFQRRKHLRLATNYDWVKVSECVNLLQRTKWAVNEPVLDVLHHYWDNSLRGPGLPSREDYEIPPKPDMTNETLKNEWRAKAAEAYQANATMRGQRVSIARTAMVADRYRGHPFWYPMKTDWRGRVYPIPTFMTPQGDDIARGLLQFHKREHDPNLSWFKIHGANCYGVKGSFEERIAWADLNWAEFDDISRDPFEYTSWHEADEPWQFLAFCMEVPRVELGYTHLPCGMDATNSGLQIFSMLTRDATLAKATNVLPSDEPQDIYQVVADYVTRRLEEDLLLAEYGFHARALLNLFSGQIPRRITKRPVMVLPYGARQWSCMRYVREALEKEDYESVGITKTHRAAKYLSRHVWDGIEATCGPAIRCMDWLQEIAKRMTAEGRMIEWTVPGTGFHVFQEYTKMQRKDIRTVIGHRVRWSSMKQGSDSLSHIDQVDGISPNFVHSLDAAVLMLTAKKLSQRGVQDVAVVHDSFSTHSTNAPLLASTLREVSREVFDRDILRDFAKGCFRDFPEPPITGDLDFEKIQDSHYMFS